MLSIYYADRGLFSGCRLVCAFEEKASSEDVTRYRRSFPGGWGVGHVGLGGGRCGLLRARLKSEVAGLQEIVLRLHRLVQPLHVLTPEDHFQFVSLRQDNRSIFGRTGYPINSGRQRARSVGLNGDIKPCLVERINQSVIHLQCRFAPRQHQQETPIGQ